MPLLLPTGVGDARPHKLPLDLPPSAEPGYPRRRVDACLLPGWAGGGEISPAHSFWAATPSPVRWLDPHVCCPNPVRQWGRLPERHLNRGGARIAPLNGSIRCGWRFPLLAQPRLLEEVRNHCRNTARRAQPQAPRTLLSKRFLSRTAPAMCSFLVPGAACLRRFLRQPPSPTAPPSGQPPCSAQPSGPAIDRSLPRRTYSAIRWA